MALVFCAQCLVPACKQKVMTVLMRTAIVGAAWCHGGGDEGTWGLKFVHAA